MKNTNIHPTAIISANATIGEGVTIGAYAIIEDNVVIGDRTIIHPHAFIRSGARIGCDCQIHPFAVIAGIPQDLKFKGEETLLIVGDRTTIREYVTLNRGTASRGKTVIGSDCLIMAYSHVAHDCIIGNSVIIGNATQIAGEVEIDNYATISGGVLVHQFVRMGQHIMVQGGSKVSKDVPPYALVGREPLVFCGINIVGLNRKNFTREQIFDINDVYRTLYQRGLNNTDAINTYLEENNNQISAEASAIIDFIKSSTRGIIRGTME